MIKKMKSISLILIGGLVGFLLSWLSFNLPFSDSENTIEADISDSKQQNKPLYWVAPMDPSYRRDAPGKSPMGMDLVPVYKQAQQSSGAGIVHISSQLKQTMGVRTQQVEVQRLTETIQTVGFVQYDKEAQLHVHPRVAGWVDKLYIQAEGEPVKVGEPLYTLYSPQLVTAQEEYLIALSRSNEALVRAARARLKSLHLTEQFITRLEKKRQVEQSVTFFAPKSGVVDALKIQEGFYVQPGTTMMQITQLNNVWVEALVPEKSAFGLVEGLNVHFFAEFAPTKKWHGKIEYIYPDLDEKTRSVVVRVKLPNDDFILKPNMFLTTLVNKPALLEALVVPLSAVIRTASQNRVVLELAEGEFKSVAVELGAEVGEQVQVLSGVVEGDKVVTSAQFLIDSESSISSDFLRFEPLESTVLWIEGKVVGLKQAERKVTIAHPEVSEWGWPAMTMDFDVASSVDFAELAMADTLHFESDKSRGYAITNIHVMTKKEKGQLSDQATLPSASVNGVINHIDVTHRVLNISREAIEKWDRPATTMDFVTHDSVDLSALFVGQQVHFTFEVGDEFTVTEIVVVEAQDDHKNAHHHGHH